MTAFGQDPAAPEAKPPAESNSIVVTASRDYRDMARTPAHVTVVTASDIEKGGFKGAVEALEKAGGVFFRSTSGNGSQAEISMRGFGENSHGRTLVLLDGRKLNRPDMAGIDWLRIPLSGVERIEILRGGSSVLYGDHAVGGVVNVITKKSSAEPAVRAEASIGSFKSDNERLTATGARGSFSYALAVEHQGTDGYRRRSAYNAWNAGGHTTWDLDDNHVLGLSLAYDDLKYELPGYLTREQMDADRRQSVFLNDSAANKYLNAVVYLDSDWGDRGRTDIGLVLDRKTIRSDMESWMSWSDWTIATVGLTPKYVNDVNLFGRVNTITAGSDFYLDRLDVKRFPEIERINLSSSAELRKKTLGFYLKDDIRLAESVTLGLGGRRERAVIEALITGASPVDADKTHNADAVDCSVTWNPAPRSRVFARFSTVYRYPFTDEQVVYSGFGADGIYADLEKETGSDIEIGAAGRLSESFEAGVTAFNMDMKNEIAWDGTRNANLDNTRRRGAEVFASWKPVESLLFRTDYTYTDAVFRDGANAGKSIPLAPVHNAGLNVTAGLPFNVTLTASARYIGAMYLGGDYANAGETIAARTVVDLLARYSPEWAENLDLYAAADNVFNTKYASAGYSWGAYYPAPERSFRAGASYRF